MCTYLVTLVGVVPLSHGFTASNTNEEDWVWLFYHLLFTDAIHHCDVINVFLHLHGDNGLWVDSVYCVTRNNMECDALLNIDWLLTEKQ